MQIRQRQICPQVRGREKVRYLLRTDVNGERKGERLFLHENSVVRLIFGSVALKPISSGDGPAEKSGHEK